MKRYLGHFIFSIITALFFAGMVYFAIGPLCEAPNTFQMTESQREDYIKEQSKKTAILGGSATFLSGFFLYEELFVKPDKREQCIKDMNA